MATSPGDRRRALIPLLIVLLAGGRLRADGLPRISSAALKTHIVALAGERFEGRRAGTPGEQRAIEYVVEQLVGRNIPAPAGMRLQPVSLLLGRRPGRSANVLGAIVPSEDETLRDVVVLGAHLDHLGTRNDGTTFFGADDNASGVAVALEVAAALAAVRETLVRPVVVVFFGAEETGLLGSNAFVRSGPLPHREIRAMVNLDMIGRPFMDQARLAVLKRVLKVDSARGLGVIGTSGRPQYGRLVQDLAERHGLSLYGSQALLSPIIQQLARNRSDHTAFERVGIPTLFFSSGESDDYHRPTDTHAKISIAAVTQRAQFVLEAVHVLAIMPPDKLPPRENISLPAGDPIDRTVLRSATLQVELQAGDNNNRAGITKLRNADAGGQAAWMDPGFGLRKILSAGPHPANRVENRRALLYRQGALGASLIGVREANPWEVAHQLTVQLATPQAIDFRFEVTNYNPSLLGADRRALFVFACPAPRGDAFVLVKQDGVEGHRWQRVTAPPHGGVVFLPQGKPVWALAETHSARKQLQAQRIESLDTPTLLFRVSPQDETGGDTMALLVCADRADDVAATLAFGLESGGTDQDRTWQLVYAVDGMKERRASGFSGRILWKPWVSFEDCRAEVVKRQGASGGP